MLAYVGNKEVRHADDRPHVTTRSVLLGEVAAPEAALPFMCAVRRPLRSLKCSLKHRLSNSCASVANCPMTTCNHGRERRPFGGDRA
jgi:hypothetical protein